GEARAAAVEVAGAGLVRRGDGDVVERVGERPVGQLGLGATGDGVLDPGRVRGGGGGAEDDLAGRGVGAGAQPARACDRVTSAEGGGDGRGADLRPALGRVEGKLAVALVALAGVGERDVDLDVGAALDAVDDVDDDRGGHAVGVLSAERVRALEA